jgi:HSP20 family protein
MVLIPWRCYRDLSCFGQEMNQLFDRFFGRELMDRPWEKTPYPRIQVAETEKEILVHVESQDFSAEELHVTFEDTLLTIKGEKTKHVEIEGAERNYVEKKTTSFTRTITVQQEIQSDAIRAQYKDGVLLIFLPKAKKKPSAFKIAIE